MSLLGIASEPLLGQHAGLDRSRQPDLVGCGEQWDPADLAQIQAHRIGRLGLPLRRNSDQRHCFAGRSSTPGFHPHGLSVIQITT